MRYVLAFDPSGNFREGKGTTGWVLIDTYKKGKLIKSGTICAKDYPSMMEYFRAHINLLEHINYTYGSPRISSGPYERYPMRVVIEDYRLYGSKVHNQINSNLETSQLIGVLKYWCYMHCVVYKMQMASEVKQRWTDEILRRYNTELPKSKHVKDALRHAIHYMKFGGEADG